MLRAEQVAETASEDAVGRTGVSIAVMKTAFSLSARSEGRDEMLVAY
jgi:hypothetical protein